MTGTAIVLVGVSSVGKTSVAEHLQLALREPYLHVGLDHFFSMFPYEWRAHPRRPGPGFWVEESRDADGSPRARIYYGEVGERLLTGMRAAVNALLATGNNVILDAMPVEDSIMPAWRRDPRAASTFWVRLTASLAALEKREQARTKGRQLGNARGHFDVMVGGDWDLIVDTDDLTPSETASRTHRDGEADDEAARTDPNDPSSGTGQPQSWNSAREPFVVITTPSSSTVSRNVPWSGSPYSHCALPSDPDASRR